MTNEQIYQSVLYNLSQIPQVYMYQIDKYLQHLQKEIKRKEANRKAIMAFAGAWNDMPDDDFNDFLNETQAARNSLFNRNFEL